MALLDFLIFCLEWYFGHFCALFVRCVATNGGTLFVLSFLVTAIAFVGFLSGIAHAALDILWTRDEK